MLDSGKILLLSEETSYPTAQAGTALCKMRCVLLTRTDRLCPAGSIHAALGGNEIHAGKNNHHGGSKMRRGMQLTLSHTSHTWARWESRSRWRRAHSALWETSRPRLLQQLGPAPATQR